MRSTPTMPDILHVTNTAPFAVYIRVYEESKAVDESTRLRAISIVCKIAAGKTIELNIPAHSGSNRILCYLNAKDINQAEKDILGEKEVAYAAKYMEIPEHDAKNSIQLAIPNFEPIPEMPKFNGLGLRKGFKLGVEFAWGLNEEKLGLDPRTLQNRASKSRAKKNTHSSIAYSKSGERNIEISEIERADLAERNKICKQAIKSLLEQCGINSPENSNLETPKNGLSGSGGGFRAMFGFRGFNTGLYECGLADTYHYCSGTSGS